MRLVSSSRLALAACVLVFALPAVGVCDSFAAASPGAHAVRHHKKKHHKKKHHERKHRRRHHHRHHSITLVTPPPATPAPPPEAPSPPTTPGPAPSAPTIPLGGYQCYSTSQVVSGIGAGYYSHYGPLIYLYPDGTYQDVNSGGYTGFNHWNQNGNTLNFTSGPLWNDVNHAHDQGTWYPDSVPMPNAGTNVPNGPYTLVIRDTLQEGGIPPSVEYSATDGPGGTSSQPQSFDYCLLKYPAT